MVVGAGDREVEPYLSRWGVGVEQRRWRLQRPVVTIGRGSSADVVIEGDLLVSPLHSKLEQASGVWTTVGDGPSRNGTFVNGGRVAGRVQLHDRDEIRVGRTVLMYCAPAEVDGVHTLIGEPLPSTARLTTAQRAVLVACAVRTARTGTRGIHHLDSAPRPRCANPGKGRLSCCSAFEVT